MEEELAIISAHSADDAEGLTKALVECRTRHAEKRDKRGKRSSRVHFAASILDELRDLLTEYTGGSEPTAGGIDK